MRTLYLALRTYLKLLLGRGVRFAYGQCGEDAIIQAACKGKRGFYVDVGAYHPVLYSNTYGLYRRGWKGVVIDPNEDMRRLFALVRPRDTFVRAGVAGTEYEAEYYLFNDGALNTFSKESRDYQLQKSWVSLIETRTVRMAPLSTLITDLHIDRIDFLNVDVEGMDAEVLESHDWRIRPRVIAVEDLTFDPDRPHASPVYAFLREKEYRFIGLGARTLIFEDER